MATLRELVTRWTFDINDKPIKDVEEKFSDLTSSVKTLSIGIAGVSASIFGYVKLSADAGEEAGKLADKFGISAQAMQELQFAARGEAQALTASLGIFSRNIVAAKEGTDAQSQAFKKLGVNIVDSNGKIKSTEDLITEAAGGFKRLENGAEKTALSMTLFGKSGAEILPFLNQGSEEIARLREEARASGAVLSDDAINGAMAFNDSLDDLINTAKGLGASFASDLFGPISEITKEIKTFISANRKLIGQRVQEVIKGLSSFLMIAVKFSGQLIDAVLGLSEVFGGLGNVLKIVGIAFALFTAGKVLFGIGSMVLAIGRLGDAFTLMNAKALLIPILIGAAIVALGLIIEDIVAFFQGKDSVTGIIVEKFKAMFSYLESGFTGLGEWAKIGLTALLQPIRMVINSFRILLDMIDLIRGKMSFKDFGIGALKKIGNSFGIGGGAGETLRGTLGLPEASTASSVAGVLPTPGSGVLAPSNTNSQKNTFNVDVAVNANGREDAAVIGKQVGNKTAGELDSLMRDTSRSFQGAGGY